MIEEEGVLIDNFLLVDRRPFARSRNARAAAVGSHIPSRNVAQNMADLRAQIAANEKGVQELRRMVAHFGLRRGASPICATCRTMPRNRCAA